MKEKREILDKIIFENSKNNSPGVIFWILVLKMLYSVFVWVIWEHFAPLFDWPKMSLFEFWGFLLLISYLGSLFNKKPALNTNSSS